MYRKHLLRISRDLNCALCQHQLTFCDCKTFKGEIEVQRIFHFCSDDLGSQLSCFHMDLGSSSVPKKIEKVRQGKRFFKKFFLPTVSREVQSEFTVSYISHRGLR